MQLLSTVIITVYLFLDCYYQLSYSSSYFGLLLRAENLFMSTTVIQKSYLYEQVADKITTLVEQGTLRPGDRIPSVRKMSSQHGVSISTIMGAYYLLESRGLIEARPQSGFYVRISPLEYPPELKISEPPIDVREVGVNALVLEVSNMDQVPGVIQLGLAKPSPEIYPTVKLNKVLTATVRRIGLQTNVYSFPFGSEELRREVAKRSLDWGCSLSSDDIIITNGATEAINLCLRAVANPGDTIAIESPTYFGILQIIQNLGMKTLQIPTHYRDGVVLQSLEAALDNNHVKACLFSLNAQNPLGFIMPDERKKQLVELLALRNIPLIEDDVYGEIYFSAVRPKIAKSYDKKGMVMLCSSFSKTLSPGFRIGWTSPGIFKTTVQTFKQSNTVGTPTILQATLTEFLKSGGFDYYLRRIRKKYAAQNKLLIHAIQNYFPKGTRCSRPSGGVVIWIEFPKWVDALKLYRMALKEKIAIAPGPMFSPTRQYQNFIRLHCGEIWSDKIEKAVVTIGRLAEMQR